jgi:hypothetical protein
MRSEHQKAVMDFCLENAEQAPVSRRVLLYRGLAEICGDLREQKNLKQMAADLETADRRCREFRFNFLSNNQ